MIGFRLLLAIFAVVLLGQTPVPTSQDAVRFSSVELVIDPHGQPLAAYQLEFVADPKRVTLVGIEGGEHPAFANPPYYDPKALSQSRVVLAGLNTGSDLPRARTRVATLHLQVVGADEPNYSAKIQVAGSPAGHPIAADVSISRGAMR